MKGYYERMPFTLPPSLDSAVRKAAEESTLSLSAYIRSALVAKLREDGMPLKENAAA